METLELKKIINSYLRNANNDILLKVKTLLEAYQNQENDPYDTLPEEIKNLIEKGLNDIKNGNTHSHEYVMTSIKKKYRIS